ELARRLGAADLRDVERDLLELHAADRAAQGLHLGRAFDGLSIEEAQRSRAHVAVRHDAAEWAGRVARLPVAVDLVVDVVAQEPSHVGAGHLARREELRQADHAVLALLHLLEAVVDARVDRLPVHAGDRTGLDAQTLSHAVAQDLHLGRAPCRPRRQPTAARQPPDTAQA